MWTNSAGLLKTLRMGSSLDHLIAKGYLYGFGYEPAMCLPGPRSGPLAPDSRTSAWPGWCPPGGQPLLSSWADAARAALPPGAARAAQHPAPIRPRRTRLNRRQSLRHRQGASSALPFPRAGAGRSPPSPGPDLSCLPSPQWLAREISKNPKNPLGGGHAAAGTTPTGNLRPAREGLCIPLTGSGRCAAPTCRGARHAGANAFGVDRGISAAARLG